MAIPSKLMHKLFAFILLLISGMTYADFDILESDDQSEITREIDELNRLGAHYVQMEDSLFYALSLHQEAYEKSEKARYIKGVIRSSNALGMGYLSVANNAQATNYFYISMRNSESVNDTQGVASAYLGLGLVMYNLDNASEALVYFNKSKKYYAQLGAERSIKLLEYLIGLCHFQLKNYSKSKYYLELVRKNAIDRGDSARINESKLYLLNIENMENPSASSFAGYMEVLAYFKRNNERVGESHTLDWLALLQLKLGMKNEAVVNASKALEIAKSVEVATTLKTSLEISIDAAYAVGDFKTAAYHLKELQTLKDSVNSAGETTRIAMMNAGYEFDKKESLFNLELEQRNKQRFILLVLLGTSLLAIFAIFFSLRSVANQRKISDKLLLNILPLDTAKELKATGSAIAKHHDGVSIVFADVKSFTAIASKLKPQDLVQMLDFYFGEFDAIVTEYGLEKIKTIGDAYMFVAGLQDNTNSAKLSVGASLRMIQAANLAGVEMRKRFGESFKFRFGIHTGEVVSGVVGQVKYAFDIWGDSVNIAARLESNSEPGKINISEDTYTLIKDEYECTPRGPIEAKNRGILEMYYVERKL